MVRSSTHSHQSPNGLGSVTHHSHSVEDSRSAVHRHHSQASSPATGTSSSFALSSPSSVQSPSLVQHNDGRFFAVNANLQQGQLFQTADGRLFTLAQSSQAVQAVREVTANNQQLDIRSRPVNEAALESVRVLTEDENQRTVLASQGDRLVTNNQAVPENQAVRFVTANQVFNSIPPAQTFRVVSSNHNTIPTTQAVRVAQVPPATHAVNRGLSDPSTSVYTGFYSNPGAGFGFNF